MYCYHTTYMCKYPTVTRTYGRTDPETIEIGAHRYWMLIIYHLFLTNNYCSSLEDNIQKAYSLVLVQLSEVLELKLKKSKGCIKSSTKFYVLELTNIINYINFKFDDQKYPHL